MCTTVPNWKTLHLLYFIYLSEMTQTSREVKYLRSRNLQILSTFSQKYLKLLLTLHSMTFETITPLIPAALAVAQNQTAVYEVSERMVWLH